jgi:hypothetical protein
MKRPSSMWFVVLAVVVLLSGSFLRLADLSRYPPGLHYDEAADMLLGRDIAWHGYNPFPVVTAYSGREALFYYLSVPLLRIFGPEPDILATRLTSALLGILTIAATIALGRAMFRDHRAGMAAALLAGAWLATNGSQVWLTRQGFRTSPQPLLEALCLWLLFVALRRRTGWTIPAALAGVFGGLSLYVYMAARVFPPWLLIPLAWLLITDRANRRTRLRQIWVFLGALALTALPIAIFYAGRPDILFDRLAQVAPSGETPSLLESLGLHLLMFFVRGDPLLRYNLYPGRPFFDPLTGILFLIGLAAAWQLVRRAAEAPVLRSAGMFVLLCPLLIAPSVIAVGGLPPSHMRSVAMVPLIFFLPVLGLISLTAALRLRLDRPRQIALVTCIVLAAAGLHTWIDYRQWGARADLFYDSDGDLMLAAEWLAQHAGPDDVVYIASTYYEHPTILARNLDHGRIRWMMADHLFLPPPDRDAVYIFPRSADSHRHVADLLPPQSDANTPSIPLGPDDAPAFRAARFPAGSIDYAAPIRPNDAEHESMGGVLRLRGAYLPPVRAGESAAIDVYWEVLRTPDRATLTPVISIEDARGNEIARTYPYFEHADRWLPGEMLVQAISVPVPTGNSPGDYSVWVTWIDRADPGFYLARLDGDGAFAGLRALIGGLHVARGHPAPVALPDGIAPVAPGLYLLAQPAIPATIEQGDRLRFALHWYAAEAPGDMGGLRLTAAREGDQPAVIWTGDPGGEVLPIRDWVAGEQIIDRYQVTIDALMPPGIYALTLTLDGVPEPVFAGQIEVIPVTRQFEPPPLDRRPGLRFGDALISLAGYEVTPARTADEISVTLAWRALRAPDRDYTVFVHVIGEDGAIFSQIDAQPARPTGRWIEGEVVTDSYRLPIPPGEYRIAVGLYLQENGLRLPIRAADGALIGDAFILEMDSDEQR